MDKNTLKIIAIFSLILGTLSSVATLIVIKQNVPEFSILHLIRFLFGLGASILLTIGFIKKDKQLIWVMYLVFSLFSIITSFYEYSQFQYHPEAIRSTRQSIVLLLYLLSNITVFIAFIFIKNRIAGITIIILNCISVLRNLFTVSTSFLFIFVQMPLIALSNSLSAISSLTSTVLLVMYIVIYHMTSEPVVNKESQPEAVKFDDF